MLVTSTYVNGGTPQTCNFCNQRFPRAVNHVAIWHGQDGYYCSPICETDALEAKVCAERADREREQMRSS
jgi:hypothetical protein